MVLYLHIKCIKLLLLLFLRFKGDLILKIRLYLHTYILFCISPYIYTHIELINSFLHSKSFWYNVQFKLLLSAFPHHNHYTVTIVILQFKIFFPGKKGLDRFSECPVLYVAYFIFSDLVVGLLFNAFLTL